jgi:hypothetical protein
MATLRQAYSAPKIVTVGTVADLTAAGGEKNTDSWQGDTHTALDWNKHNSATPEVIGSDVLD